MELDYIHTHKKCMKCIVSAQRPVLHGVSTHGLQSMLTMNTVAFPKIQRTILLFFSLQKWGIQCKHTELKTARVGNVCKCLHISMLAAAKGTQGRMPGGLTQSSKDTGCNHTLSTNAVI